jgi:predicted metal-dependent phosphoesterase TrpH/glycosyltransferase involved in cell wall biosynthesis
MMCSTRTASLCSPAVPERFSIAQVAPRALEDAHEVGTFVGELSRELAERGHRVLLLAPARSPERVRDSRKAIRAARERPEALFDPDGGVRVLSVGELLPGRRRGVAPAPPVDIARTIEEVLTIAPLDFVHVHEPWAPSAGSVALRHSRALNVGSFHAPAERVLSTQVARRFVELFFGRLDARTASYEATAELLAHSFPARYRLLRPGVTASPRAPRAAGAPVRIVFADREERAALRLFLRALRRVPEALPWDAVVVSSTGAIPTLRSSLRERVHITDDEHAALASADVVVTASLGQVTAPGVLLRALGAGAVPVAARIPVYEEVLSQGDLGLLFEPADVDVLAGQLERIVADDGLRAQLSERGGSARPNLSWSRVADEVEAIYAELAALRHDPDPRPHVRARLAKRKLIDVDLHMHTDHSSDCATPVEVLLATARDVGLGAIAVTDHNEISGALDARAKAAEYGVKVIVGEEVKTADQGEVIGLFIEEKIARGMTMAETIAEIRRQGGLVYVPHPFDRMHAVPDYEHMLAVVADIDAIEVFNPRIAIPAFNEEAVRFAAKYRIVGGAGSDSHVAQGLGSVRISMRDFDGPEEFLESLRDADIAGKPSSLRYAHVQALKFLQTRATPPAARRATRRRKVARAVAGRGGS